VLIFADTTIRTRAASRHRWRRPRWALWVAQVDWDGESGSAAPHWSARAPTTCKLRSPKGRCSTRASLWRVERSRGRSCRKLFARTRSTAPTSAFAWSAPRAWPTSPHRKRARFVRCEALQHTQTQFAVFLCACLTSCHCFAQPACPTNAGTTIMDMVSAFFMDFSNSVAIAFRCLADGGFQACVCKVRSLTHIVKTLV